MAPLVIYHGNCADGFGAACAIYMKHPTWEFYPGVHGNEPPDVTGREVYMVDFSYKRPVVEAMLEKADKVIIIDHHVTAMEDLAGLEHPKYFGIFDMDRSGAGMAWDHFHPEVERPPLINHLEDRDLWRFKLEGTRELQSVLFSYPYVFDVWVAMIKQSRNPQWIAQKIEEGKAIERKHMKDVREWASICTRSIVLAGKKVPLCNGTHFFTSDLGHLLAEGRPFAAVYWDTPEGRVFSLRSHEDGDDVGAVAKLYGGGGHKHAAGFRMPLGWEGDE